MLLVFYAVSQLPLNNNSINFKLRIQRKTEEKRLKTMGVESSYYNSHCSEDKQTHRVGEWRSVSVMISKRNFMPLKNEQHYTIIALRIHIELL